MMSDLIGRGELIEDLRDSFVRGFENGYKQGLMEATKWIPVTEGPPKENGRYFVTNRTWGTFQVDWNIWVNGEWLYPNSAIVAWMPFPGPYQGAKE